MKPIDLYFQRQEEPARSTLLFLRSYILQIDPNITEAWKYGMPFYCYNDKMLCYLWIHKKLHQPYLGIVEGHRINHPKLIQEKRARMKIILFHPEEDIPLATVNTILQKALKLYQQSKIKTVRKKAT